MVEMPRKKIGSYVATQAPNALQAKIYVFGMGDVQKIQQCFPKGSTLAMEGTLKQKLGLTEQLFSVTVPAVELEEGLAQWNQTHPVFARLPVDDPEAAARLLQQLHEMSKSAGIDNSRLMI